MIHAKVSLTHQNSKPPKDDLSKQPKGECKTLKELQSDIYQL